MSATANINDSKIANRYAKALFDQAQEQAAVHSVLNELNELKTVYETMPELASFLANPAIPKADKVQFVNDQFVSKTSALTGNLLKLMADNERVALLPLVAEQFKQLLDTFENNAVADVVTPKALDSAQEVKLKQSLKAAYGYSDITLNVMVEPSILGGMVVKIQDKVIDGSFSGKLNTLAKQMGVAS